MTNKKNFWLILVIFSLVGQVAWVVENMYFNVFIYEMFNASAEQISLMVALSAVSATLTTLFMGALSDKLGKRKVFMAGGYIAWGITILAFSLIRKDIIGGFFGLSSAVTSVCITLVIIMDVVMTFFGSTANDAAFNAWLTDETDSSNRGKAEGVNAMMPLVAILVVFGGFMSFDLSIQSSWTLIFAILGVLVIIIGVLGFFLIEEKTQKVSENSNYFANIFYGFRPKVIKENKMLYFCLIAFAVFGISIQIFMPYLILYYTESLKMDNYVLIMAPAIILASVFTLFYGRVYDKFKFEKSVFPALLTLILGYVLLYFFRNTALVFIGSLLMMCGYLAGMAVFGAVIRDNTPPKKAGMFQGLRIFAQVLIPGIIGPFIGAGVLKNAEQIINNDGTTSFIPNENIFLSALIVAVILVVLLIFLFYFKKKKEIKK
ncbi:MAG: MFS transporter [Clostridiales bacterium]|nr:MFS transporter [Clostridiales bacterium]